MTWKLSKARAGSLSSNFCMSSHGPSPTPTSTMDKGYELQTESSFCVRFNYPRILNLPYTVRACQTVDDHLAMTMESTVLRSCGLRSPSLVSTLLVTCNAVMMLSRRIKMHLLLHSIGFLIQVRDLAVGDDDEYMVLASGPVHDVDGGLHDRREGRRP